MGCPDDRVTLARKFVKEYCINQRKERDSSVHNMSFYLLAKSEDLSELVSFLEEQEAKKSSGQPIFFDVTYALNVCKQQENKLQKDYDQLSNYDNADMKKRDKLRKKINLLKKAQIVLYGILNVFSKSVELALQCGDTELAKKYANKATDKKVQRELWMKIAKHLFNNTGSGNQNVQNSLKFIRENSKLKVEDLLEEFPKEA